MSDNDLSIHPDFRETPEPSTNVIDDQARPATTHAGEDPTVAGRPSKRRSVLSRCATRIIGGPDKSLIEIIAAVALAWFAFTTDRIYHHIAELTSRQVDILHLLSVPMFQGGIKPIRNEQSGIFDQDNLEINNIESPIIVGDYEIIYYLTLELEDAPKSVLIPTSGNYNVSFRENNATGPLFHTKVTDNRGIVFDVYKRILYQGVQGHKGILDHTILVKVLYTDKLHELNTEYLEASDWGLTYTDAVRWKKAHDVQMAGFASGRYIDFSKDKTADQIFGKIATIIQQTGMSR